MLRIRTVLMSLAVSSLVASALPVHAQAVQLTDPTQLSPGDAVAVYPNSPASGGLYTPVPVASPYTAGAAGNTVTFTDAGGFQVDSTDYGFSNVNPLTSGNIFTPGTLLLDNAVVSQGGSVTSFNGPDTLTFGSPVSEFGVLAFAENDQQDFTFNVFDGVNSLGTFSLTPDTNAAGPDFTPAFLGARADTGSVITSVQISDPDASAQNGFVLASVAYPAIPEPAPVALLSLGLVALPFIARRRAA